MRLILEQMTTDPKASQEYAHTPYLSSSDCFLVLARRHMRNPDLARKILRLIAAGVIGTQ
jgi:hypothetical protein